MKPQEIIQKQLELLLDVSKKLAERADYDENSAQALVNISDAMASLMTSIHGELP